MHKIYAIFLAFGLFSCVEDEQGSGDVEKEKPRDSKFLIPTESQSSQQMKQHRAADKKLISSDG